MREICMSGSMSGMWKRVMVEPLRHRQTKEAATDMFDLQPPRHISTLHSRDCQPGPRKVCLQRCCGSAPGLCRTAAFDPSATWGGSFFCDAQPLLSPDDAR